MIQKYHAAREAARRIAGAMDRCVRKLENLQVEQEPHMTDRMLGAIEESLHGRVIKGIQWDAKTLTDHGARTQESIYGADFMGVLRITIPELAVVKGFLAQAKLVRRGRVNDVRELKDQCEKMLRLSPDSYVFLYSTNGVRVVPATSVLGANVEPTKLSSLTGQGFFEKHLQCVIGDRAIRSATPAELRSLLTEYHIRKGLLLTARVPGTLPI